MGRRKVLVIGILISIITSVLLIVFTADRQTLEAVLQIRVEYILMAAIVHTFSFYLKAKKTKHLCSALGSKISVKNAFLNVMTGVFMASITPASAGGEPIRILLLKSNADVPVGKGTAVVIMERLLDAVFVLGAFIPSLIIINKYATGSKAISYTTKLMLVVSSIIIFSVCILFIYMIRKPENADKLFNKTAKIINKITKSKYKDKIDEINLRIKGEVSLFYRSFQTFLRSGKLSLLFSLVYTLLAWIVHFLALWFILEGLNYTESFTDVAAILFATQIVLLIIMIIPVTPGASGIAELGGYALFLLFVPSTILAVVVIAWRAITYYINLILGFAASLITLGRYGKQPDMKKETKKTEI